jgi:hypothetical protein
MRRVGALLALVLFAAVYLIGCEEKTTGVAETGIEIQCGNCYPFKVDVFVDGDDIGSFSSEEPKFFNVPTGSHSLYAVSNAVVHVTNEGWCWTLDFSVSEGNVTEIILECSDDSHCGDTTPE